MQSEAHHAKSLTFPGPQPEASATDVSGPRKEDLKATPTTLSVNRIRLVPTASAREKLRLRNLLLPASAHSPVLEASYHNSARREGARVRLPHTDGRLARSISRCAALVYTKHRRINS